MHEESLNEIRKEYHGSYKSYTIGFIASLLLTCLSFYLVITRALPLPILALIIVGLALTQAIIQLIYFVHLGQEEKPRWETLIFFFMVLILLIIALGTLWVMFDLNDRVMSFMSH